MTKHIKLFEEWESPEDWEEPAEPDIDSTGIKQYNAFNHDGEKHGYWEEFYKDGTLKRKGYYKNGLEDGPWNEFWFSGIRKEDVNYKNGARHGIAKNYRFGDGFNSFDQLWDDGVLKNES